MPFESYPNARALQLLVGPEQSKGLRSLTVYVRAERKQRSMSRTIRALIVLLTLGVGACERSPRASEDHGKGAHPDTTGTEVGGKSTGSATETGIAGVLTGLTAALASGAIPGSATGGGGSAGAAPR